MRTWWRSASVVAVLVWGFAAACSSTPTAAGPVVLRGTYDAAGPGAYLRMTFYDSQHFFLFRSPCDLTRAASANACMESGTYAVDGVNGLLALRDASTGTIAELSFSVLSAAPATQASRVRTQNIPLVGSGGPLTGTPGGSLTGSMMGGMLLVKDGGVLAFADAGPLVTDGGANPVQAFNANGQPFQQGAGDAGATSPSSAGAGAGSGSGGGGSPGGGGTPSSGAGSSGAPSTGGTPSTAGGTDAGSAPTSSTNVNLLYEGSCAFLKKCDSFSKSAPAGSVVWGCLGTAPCSDGDPYVAGPDKSYCGKVVTFCTSGGQCTNGTVKDTSNVHGWEGGQAVMRGLGLSFGDGTCSNGGFGGGNVTASF